MHIVVISVRLRLFQIQWPEEKEKEGEKRKRNTATSLQEQFIEKLPENKANDQKVVTSTNSPTPEIKSANSEEIRISAPTCIITQTQSINTRQLLNPRPIS